MKTSEIIARDIVLDISERGLKDGDLLPPEASMLRHYEVGRASLREALRLLEVQGLIHIRAGPRGGPIVGSPSAENLAPMLTLYFGMSGATYEDLTKVMLMLQPLMAEVAASTKLSRADVSLLKASLGRACGVQSAKRNEAMLLDFHRIVANFGGNPVWSLIADAVGLIFAEHVIATVDSRGFHDATIDDHNEIGDAILAGKPALAKKLMLEHTERMIEFYRGQAPALFNQLIEWR